MVAPRSPKTACVPVTLPSELARHLWRIYCRVNDDTDLETSASGIAETAFELFLELSPAANDAIIARCLSVPGAQTKRKAYSLPVDLVRRFEHRCTALNDREDRQGRLKPSVVAQAAFVNLIERDFAEIVASLKRFHVRKRRK